MRSVALSLVLFLAPAGCLPAPAMEFEPAADRPDDAVPQVTTQRDVVVSYDGQGESTPDAVVTSVPIASTFRPPDPVLFRLGAGYGMLGQLDFAPCRGQGLDKGYLHMRVTFRHSGHVVRASVESAAPPPDEALHCIAEQLQVAMVPVFDGEDVTLSKSYFVN